MRGSVRIESMSGAASKVAVALLAGWPAVGGPILCVIKCPPSAGNAFAAPPAVDGCASVDGGLDGGAPALMLGAVAALGGCAARSVGEPCAVGAAA